MSSSIITKALAKFPNRNFVFVYGTLKQNQPNFPVMKNNVNGCADFICKAVTIDKYPLVIASRYNVPYLIAKKGLGHEIVGEIFAVDDKMLKFLDDFEGHPTYYMRNRIKVRIQDDNGDCYPLEDFKPWIYMIENYKPDMLELPYHYCYDSYGPHGLRYVERCERIDVPYASKGHTEKGDILKP